MIPRRRALTVAGALLAALLLPAAALAQVASPLAATIFLDNPPADATYEPTTPIKLHLVLKNVSGAPIITTQGFSATDFWRLLYFALDDVGIITNVTGAPGHGFVQYGTCHYRKNVIVPAVQVVPVEVLATDFGLEFIFDDVRAHFDLSRPGRYTVTANVSFLAYGAGAIINDCNIEFGGKSLLSIGETQTADRQEFAIASNALEFFVKPSDVAPPTTTASALPLPNAAGWNNQNVTVTLSAVDNAGGSGVKNIAVTLFGAQPGTQTIAGASGAVGVTTQGITTLFFSAEDNAGNKEAVTPLAVRVDTAPPVVTPPAAITVPATESGGARGNASPALAAFLAGGTAADNLDPSPARLSPQIAGADAGNTTLLPLGTTTVTFRFRDVAGNTGGANSTVTVGEAPAITAAIVGSGKSKGVINFYDLRFSNGGAGTARSVVVTQFGFQTLDGPGRVSYNTEASPALPISVGDLASGASRTIRVFFTVPPRVSRFMVTETGRFQDESGTTLTFSSSQTVSP